MSKFKKRDERDSKMRKKRVVSVNKNGIKAEGQRPSKPVYTRENE